ncbi:MAG: transglycosylase SLT domain-containing protein [Clostridiaceae bacterium]|jgi:soluble lytic murein transglycosylase|nr:transglycosylase SLT domain-containing protein [Clostridiaceae bacterium]
MKVKLLIGGIALIIALGALFYYYSSSQYDTHLDEYVEENGDYEPESTIDIMNLLIEVRAGRQNVKDEFLLKLSENKNTIGYYSNLILASRYDSRNKDAQKFYTMALELYPTNNVRFNYASYLARIGNISEATKEYLSILPENRALQSLIDLNVDDKTICDSLSQKGNWKDLEEFLESKFQNDLSLTKYYVRALFQQEKYNEVIPLLEELYNKQPTDSEIGWWYGRTLEQTNQKEKAMEIYSSIGTKGAYRLGVLLENSKQSKSAMETYKTSNEPISLWRAARMQEESRLTEQALETYLKIIEQESAYQDDAAYRVYVLNKRLGRENSQEVLDILSKHPAWMERIGKEHAFDNVVELEYKKPEFLETVELYESKGLEDIAAIELSIGSKLATIEDKLALGDWYLEKGNVYQSVIWGLRSLLDKPNKRGYELSHPRAYEDLVLKAAQKYNVEPELIWATMKEESTFKHDVSSWAGAMGLMQIMPATGKDIASRLNTTIEDSDLLNPEININFGTFYINSMLKMFSGDIDRAMAAYNGGPGNVSRWNNSPLGKTKEDFPTAITYFETQEYITKIKNSYYVYKWLYNKD